MWNSRVVAIGLLLVLGACAPLPPHPLDSQAKQFRPVSDKGVIYVFRESPDFGSSATTISFDGLMIGTTYPGTYYRWEAAPGLRSISGVSHDTGEVKLKVEPGKIYYVQQAVWSSRSSYVSFFNVVDEARGKAGVLGTTLLDTF